MQLLWPPSCLSASKPPHHPDIHFANTGTVHTTIRALVKLNMSNNELYDGDGAPAGKALSDMLAANSTLKELDISNSAKYSSSKGGPSFAKAFAVGLSANGALASLDLSQNSVPESEANQIKAVCQSKGISLKI